MINTDRIVPVEKIDLISLYALILLQDQTTNAGLEPLKASTIDGVFSCDDGIYIADQPVKTFDFTESTGTLYFVADYGFEGFTIDGVAAEAADGSDDVVADGATLYQAVLSSGDVTIAKVGF